MLVKEPFMPYPVILNADVISKGVYMSVNIHENSYVVGFCTFLCVKYVMQILIRYKYFFIPVLVSGIALEDILT